MSEKLVTVQDIARRAGVEEKMARRWLRAANLSWHVHQHRWAAPEGSAQHHDMERVISRRGR